MKVPLFFPVILLVVSLNCKTGNNVNEINPDTTESSDVLMMNKINVKVGAQTFTVTLTDTPAAKAFAAQLPLTLTMNELNNNEKFAQLPKSVPTNASVPASIQAGDLMLYGSSTLVLFYKGFSTTYSYTKIGKIKDVSGLIAALGVGDVKVSFELPKE